VGEYRRKKLVPSADGLKPKEQKVPYDVVVNVTLIEAGDNVVDSQLLLRVLEQRDKRALTSVRKLVLSDCHIQPILPLNRFPLAANSSNASSGKRQLDCLLDADLVA